MFSTKELRVLLRIKAGKCYKTVRPRLAAGDAEHKRIGAQPGVVRYGNGDGGTRQSGGKSGPEAKSWLAYLRELSASNCSCQRANSWST